MFLLMVTFLDTCVLVNVNSNRQRCQFSFLSVKSHCQCLAMSDVIDGSLSKKARLLLAGDTEESEVDFKALIKRGNALRDDELQIAMRPKILALTWWNHIEQFRKVVEEKGLRHFNSTDKAWMHPWEASSFLSAMEHNSKYSCAVTLDSFDPELDDDHCRGAASRHQSI